MKKYEPQFLGKVIPADDPSKLTEFCAHQYDSFHKIFNACKDQSEQIIDVHTVETKTSDPKSLSVLISADKDTVGQIVATAKGDPSISFNGNVITATTSVPDKK